ncbi:sialin [Hydra vulgaris]|uniref:sialin n=1 Tax=Hydra vulgaris TaxID=6087 RepID=UPI001F5E8989|nr:sialin [Hydra vulgaris]
MKFKAKMMHRGSVKQKSSANEDKHVEACNTEGDRDVFTNSSEKTYEKEKHFESCQNVVNENLPLDRRKFSKSSVPNPENNYNFETVENINNDKNISSHTKYASDHNHINHSLTSLKSCNTTESDILHLKGKTNTARVKLQTSFNTTTSLPFEQSIEEQDLRTQVGQCGCMSKRYVLAILSFFGFFNVYCLRVDLSVALVAMTNNHTRVMFNGTEYLVAPEFNWSTQLQGHILSAFYYGYLLTQIPGGYIAARFGGKNLFGIAILFSAVLTLMTPMASRSHWMWLFLLRLIEGLCEGCIYPAMYALWSRWAPPMERAKLVTIPHSGSYAGSVAGTLIAGYLCELCGWAWVFYLFGLLALMWVAVWMIMISDSPEEDNHISTEEKNMILKSLEEDQTSHLLKGSLPWQKIITSMPFLAILVAHTCEGWGFGTMQTGLPKFLSEAMNFRISKTGEYTATLYLVMGINVFLSGQLADFIRQRCYLSVTTTRKSFTVIGFLANAVAFIISMYMFSPEGAVIVIIVGAGIETLAWAGFGINHLDIAPRYASVLFGITNTCATVPNILSPILVGVLTDLGEAGSGGRQHWDRVFYISAAMFLFGALFYGFFASGERQSWAADKSDESLEEEVIKEVIDQTEQNENTTQTKSK